MSAASIFVPPLVPYATAASIAVGGASLFINFQQGDTLGIAVDTVGLGLDVGPAFKSAYKFLGQTDSLFKGCDSLLAKVFGGGGCFVGETITYRLMDDNALLLVDAGLTTTGDDSEGVLMAACVVVGVAGYIWQERRRRKRAEEEVMLSLTPAI